MSCCGRGGAWFKNCGGIGSAKLQHTWYEGIQACEARPQSKTVTGEEVGGVRQKGIDSSLSAGVANGQSVAEASNRFASTPVNTSPRSMLDTKKSVAAANHTADSLLTIAPSHELMTNTPRVYFNMVSFSVNSQPAIASLVMRECANLLAIIIHNVLVVMLV